MVSISSAERSMPLYLRWLAATGIGTGLGIAAGILATFAVQNVPGVNPDRFFVWAMFLGIGAFLGLAQGRILTAAIGRPVGWFPATIVGFVLATGALIVWRPDLPESVIWDDALLFAAMGALIGVPQGWALRHHLPLSGLWIAASALGFQSYLWLALHPTTFMLELILVGAILGAVGAMVTGLLLHRLRP